LVLYLGHGVGFCTAALTEVGFGIVSSSMPALNHLLISTVPRTLEAWFGSTRIGSWFRAESSEIRSFKDTFRGTQSGSEKNVHKTTTIEASGFSDDPPSYHTRTPAPNFSRKTSPRDIYTNESLDDKNRYNPGWLGARFESREDLETSSSGKTDCIYRQNNVSNLKFRVCGE
jgi:hypothetical protein